MFVVVVVVVLFRFHVAKRFIVGIDSWHFDLSVMKAYPQIDRRVNNILERLV